MSTKSMYGGSEMWHLGRSPPWGAPRGIFADVVLQDTVLERVRRPPGAQEPRLQSVRFDASAK